MLFRLPNGSLLELNKNNFISDKDYYSKIMEIQNLYVKEETKNYVNSDIKDTPGFKKILAMI
jgi:3-methyladenine DNA glycosylase AlkC